MTGIYGNIKRNDEYSLLMFVSRAFLHIIKIRKLSLLPSNDRRLAIFPDCLVDWQELMKKGSSDDSPRFFIVELVSSMTSLGLI